MDQANIYRELSDVETFCADVLEIGEDLCELREKLLINIINIGVTNHSYIISAEIKKLTELGKKLGLLLEFITRALIAIGNNDVPYHVTDFLLEAETLVLLYVKQYESGDLPSNFYYELEELLNDYLDKEVHYYG
tara:strand:+ start:1174 stop:1578 length:405 start_codon:yes stop_codon:yes gene_type:complete